MLHLLYSLALSLTIGYLITTNLLRTPGCQIMDRLLAISLGTGFGLGLSACIFFLGMLIFTPSGNGLLIFDGGLHFGLIIILSVFGRQRSKSIRAESPAAEPCAGPLLIYLFWASLFISTLTFVLMALQSPYGGQDAQAIGTYGRACC